jgi:arabinogalactan endo-1,4-beta-galactosidase
MKEINMKTNLLLLIVMLAVGGAGCHKNGDTPDEEPQRSRNLILGADLSLLPSYTAAAAVFKDINGQDVEPLTFLKQKGLQIVRCRLFVKPDLASEACQDLQYVTDFCRRIQQAGMGVMLDFHYSDTWADPGKQFKPGEWEQLPAGELPSRVYDYTRSSLLTLKEAGVKPAFIQTGNEITDGMLWDDAKVSVWGDQWDTPQRWSLFLSILAKAAEACREIFPEAGIIIHTDRSGDHESARRFYTRLNEAGADYDLIGLSYYPFWHGTFADVEATLKMFRSLLPDKKIIFAEIAYPYRDWGYPSDSRYAKAYPSSPQGQADFTSAFLSLLETWPQVAGALWWFAEETYSPHKRIHPDMHRGLFDNQTGRALPALDAFKQ